MAEQSDYEKSTELRDPIKLIADTPSLVGAEIGVYRGTNALNMLQQLDIEKLYLIDPYKSYPNSSGRGKTKQEKLDKAREIAEEKLDPYNSKIEWLQYKSEEAFVFIPELSLDFLYIDGDHRGEIVAKELELYYPRIKYSGLISGDDYRKREGGLRKAVREFADERGLELRVKGIQWWFFK